MRRNSFKGEWTRFRTHEISDDNFVYVWEYKSSDVTYTIYYREFYSLWGMMTQVSIMKKTSEKCRFETEPNMEEKIYILNSLKLYSNDSYYLEVFPKKENIVDNYDMYHVWSLQKSELPFKGISNAPFAIFGWKYECLMVNKSQVRYEYKKVKKNGLTIYYIRREDKQEMFWKEKQTFKDAIIGKDRIVIEFIITQKNYSIAIMVCIPENIKSLPFGLRK